MLSQVRGLYKTTKNHTYCNAIITIISSLPGEDGGGGPGLVTVWDDAHAVRFQAGVVDLDSQVVLRYVGHDLVPLPLVDEAHVLAVGAHSDVKVLVVVVEEVQLDHLVVPEAPHRHVGTLGV